MDAFYSGEYHFDVQKKISLTNGETIAIWSSCDALVLKVLTWIIQERLKPYLLKVCYHLKGHGGLKRWKLKEAIQVLNQTLNELKLEKHNELKLEKHPEKTSIGRTCRGFDFLGYHFGQEEITISEKTIVNFINKALRLYEQEPAHRRVRMLGEYRSRWLRWIVAGLFNEGPQLFAIT